MYLNDIILYFGHILIIDQQSRTILVAMCSKTTSVAS